MNQKKALKNVFEFIDSHFSDDMWKVQAARAFFVASWLEDKNWHGEAHGILAKVESHDYLKVAFADIQENEANIRRLREAASLMNYIFGWGFERDIWQETSGAPFVDTLWKMITESVNRIT